MLRSLPHPATPAPATAAPAAPASARSAAVASPAAARRPSPWRSLRHRSLRRWTAVGGISMAGTWMQAVATNLVIWHLTGSAALTGACVAVQAVPGLLLGPLAGALVDRFPVRATAAAGQVGLGVASLTAAALAATGRLDVPALVVLGLGCGAVAPVDGPACSLLANTLVPAEDTASAIAVSSVAASAGRLVGTGAAGVAVAAVGVSWAYALNGLTFLLVAAVVPTLRAHPDHAGAQPITGAEASAHPTDPAEPPAVVRASVGRTRVSRTRVVRPSVRTRPRPLPGWFASLALVGQPPAR